MHSKYVRSRPWLAAGLFYAAWFLRPPFAGAQASAPRAASASPAAPAQSRAAHKPARRTPTKKARVPPAPPITSWLLDVHLGLQMDFGKNDLDTERAGFDSESAGDGIGGQIGLRLTPLWLGQHAFGIGVDLGNKYTGSIWDGGGDSVNRFPLVVSAQLLIAIANAWHLTLTAGPEWDLNLHYKTSQRGRPDTDDALGSPRGLRTELGALFVTGHVGISAQVRYTRMRYHVGAGATALRPGDEDASSYGVVFSVHYLL